MNRRRALRWTLASLALLVLLGLAFTGWVLRSEGGRDWLLARVVASLPADSSLQWKRLEGRVSGPLVVHGLDYRQPGGLRVQADRLRIDHSVWPLLARRWQVRRLELEGVRIALPRNDKPFEWPRWPEVLPRLELPLSITVDALQVRGLELVRDDAVLARFDRLRAGLTLGPGELAVRELAADGPRLHLAGAVSYRPREAYRSQADLRLRHEYEDRADTELHLVARGDLADFTASLQGKAPGPLSASVHLREGGATPQWRLDLRSEGLQPARLGLADDASWQGRLRVDGHGGEARLGGRLERETLAFGLDGSRVQASEHGLALSPLRLELAQGPVQATGRVDFSGSPAALSLRVASDGLRLAATQPGGQDVVASGALQVDGRLDQWRLAGDLQLQRGPERAQVGLRGQGSDTALDLQALKVRTPGGGLDGEARLQWAPGLAVRADLRLAAFDPGYFVPDFPGAIHGDLHVEAARDGSGRWSGSLRAPGLQGQLRDRPLRAHADVRWKDDAGAGEMQLALGESRLDVHGQFGDRLDLQVEARPLDLADLSPSASGRLRGSVTLRGPRAAPEIDGDLQGSKLQWNGLAAGSLHLKGRLPHAPGRGQVAIAASTVHVGGRDFDRAELQLQGNLEAWQAEGSLAGEAGELRLAGEARHAGQAWSGRLVRLRLAPARGVAWALQAPTAWRWNPDGLQFQQACLAQERGPGAVCAEWTGDRAEVSGHDLGIALIEPWLPAATADYESYGVLGFDGRLQRQGTAWSGVLNVHSAQGGVRLRAAPDASLLAYRDLQVRTELAQGRLQVAGGAQLSQGGHLSVQGTGGLDASDPIEGSLAFDLRDIGWMELLSPDLAAPQGRLEGRLQLAGTRAAPRLGGQARLLDLRAELPALGVALRDGQLSVTGAPGEALRIDGSVRSGEGRLVLAGTYDPRDADRALRVSLTGADVAVADTPELEATASPNLQLSYLDGQLQLRGSVRVPRARVNLEGLDRGVSPSSDVVVLDPREADTRTGLVFDTEITVQVGDDVRLRGFGLDGKLGGELAIRDKPGRVPVANGTLTLSGRYRAYGRDLRIRRARLSWLNSAYDNPVLDVLAEREFDEVTVGVQVRGRAQSPQTSITSTPAMGTAEAVSWLLLGRPIETATGSETQRISASAMALSAGSGLLAQRLGVKLGLDSAGVVENRALGGSTLVVGKRLSPRLFVSYGVSLLGTGQVVMLKYLLKRGLSLGLESGAGETAASLDWRKEK